MADWIVPAVSLIAAGFVSTANYAIQRWRYAIDQLAASVKLLCDEINAVADLATKYWLLDLSQKADAAEGSKLEAELVGRQLRLQELVAALHMQDPRMELGDVEALLDNFCDAITGGDFKVRNRPPNLQQLQQAQFSAARLNGQLRVSLSKRAKKSALNFNPTDDSGL